MVADGLTALIGNAIWSQGGRTPQLPASAQFGTIEFPSCVVEIGAVPIIGPIYEHLISGYDLITYTAFLMVPLTYWALYSTRFGLRLRAVGENPAAVDTAGISVRGDPLQRGDHLRPPGRACRGLSRAVAYCPISNRT